MKGFFASQTLLRKRYGRFSCHVGEIASGKVKFISSFACFWFVNLLTVKISMRADDERYFIKVKIVMQCTRP